MWSTGGRFLLWHRGFVYYVQRIEAATLKFIKDESLACEIINGYERVQRMVGKEREAYAHAALLMNYLDRSVQRSRWFSASSPFVLRLEPSVQYADSHQKSFFQMMTHMFEWTRFFLIYSVVKYLLSKIKEVEKEKRLEVLLPPINSDFIFPQRPFIYSLFIYLFIHFKYSYFSSETIYLFIIYLFIHFKYSFAQGVYEFSTCLKKIYKLR